jgi:hypothetical protein
LFLATLWLVTSVASAHPLLFTDTTLTLRDDRTFQVDLIVDLDALALGAPQDSDDAELVATIEALSPDERADLIARLARLFERRIRVRFDDSPTPFSVSFPDLGTPRATESEIPTVLGLTARVKGTIPRGATDVSFFASRAFSDVHLTVVDEARDVTVRSVLERGARSEPFDMSGPVEPPRAGATARRYLQLGFSHIIPDGLDHILFVLGLFLVARQIGPLVWQVTAFTLAHAMTLGLGTFGVISLSPRIVEPLIALSIVWIAVENILLRPDDRRTLRGFNRRIAIVFLFGLLHGLGFARVLTDLGLPQAERLFALATFNAGIELGQLGVIATAFLTVGWFRNRPWYRDRIVVPASASIALTGLFWTVERMLSQC